MVRGSGRDEEGNNGQGLTRWGEGRGEPRELGWVGQLSGK